MGEAVAEMDGVTLTGVAGVDEVATELLTIMG